MVSSAHGIEVNEGADPARAVQLTDGQVLMGVTGADPVPTAVLPSSQGTYTPTLTNTANLSASTANVTRYTRIGNQVHVSGVLSATITTTLTLTTLGISLPVASDLASSTQLSGVAAIGVGAVGGASIVGDASGDKAVLSFTPVVTGAQVIPFSFDYQVI